MRWTLGHYRREHGTSDWYVTKPGCYAEEVEVMPASFTDEDVERVALAIASADDHGYDTDEEGLEHYRPYYVAAARAALSAYLEPITKGDT